MLDADRVAATSNAASDRADCVHARTNAERPFVILDEAQNTTSEQMKMFLTRLGFGSRP
jgi:phosphate starvation-inducible protein PhoH